MYSKGVFTWENSHRHESHTRMTVWFRIGFTSSGSQRGGPWSPGALKFLLWSPEPYHFTDWSSDPFLAVEPGAQRHFARSPEPSIFKFDHRVPRLHWFLITAFLCLFVRVNGHKETECEEKTVHDTSIRGYLSLYWYATTYLGIEWKLCYNRPFRLTQCCTQFKSPGDKILCVLYLHYNVTFTFKWYGNFWNKTFYSQKVWIGYNIELAE